MAAKPPHWPRQKTAVDVTGIWLYLIVAITFALFVTVHVEIKPGTLEQLYAPIGAPYPECLFTPC